MDGEPVIVQILLQAAAGIVDLPVAQAGRGIGLSLLEGDGASLAGLSGRVPSCCDMERVSSFQVI